MDQEKLLPGGKTYRLHGKDDFISRFMNVVRACYKLNPNVRVLDYCCGTGSNGINLMNEVKYVMLLDPSSDKIELCKKAVKEIKNTNYEIVHGDIMGKKYEPFDIVVTSMAFHHIKDIDAAIKSISENLKSGGMCFVCDLYPEEGDFHPPGVYVAHHGFNVEEFSKRLFDNGFTKVNHLDFGHYYEHEKEYPLFVVIAEK